MSNNHKDTRLRSSIVFEVNNIFGIIDTGPDFRYQMLKNNIHQLDFVLYTHSHKDHIAGLDDIKAYNFWQQSAIDIYSTEFTLDRIKKEFDYIFSSERYPGIPELKTNIIHPSEQLFIHDIPITPILVKHLKMDVLGFRIYDFTYITDANYISEEEKNKIRGSKVLVLNALRHEKHISHFTLQEAIDLANELEIPEVYFTHISHQLGLHDEIEKTLPRHMHLAYDGLQITV